MILHSHSCRVGVALAALITCVSALADPVGIAPDRILMRAKAGFPNALTDEIVRVHGARQVDEIAQIGVRILKVPAHARERVLAALQRNPNIEFAENDYLLKQNGTANDVHFASQWHLPKIGAPAAWDVTKGSSSVIIAVIDSGVEATHPDLALKLVAGWNFYDGNSNTADVNGHGTAVAGTAAASSDNTIGVASVAPGCSIMPIRVADASGYAYESRIAQGLNWAADRRAKVANISFRASNSSTIRSAAQYFQSKGGVVVMSSGNESLFDTASDNPYVLTVSATDSNDAVAPWSNTGNNVDLSAPGVNVLTTTLGSSYAYWSGTSFSAPVVAGAAALVFSAKPTLTPAQVMDLLKKSSDDLGAAGWDTAYGAGRVNVEKALAPATTTPPPVVTTDTIAPVVRITSPVEGSKASMNTSVKVLATDNVAVKKVELYVNGTLVSSSTSAPFTTTWNTKKVVSGSYRLQTRAFDAAGNNSLSQIVTVRK